MTSTNETIQVSERAREAAAALAIPVYGKRIANDILDGTIEHHHFLDTFARFERDLLAGQSVGDYVLVPREPTEAMLDRVPRHQRSIAPAMFRAMLSGVPAPKALDRDDDRRPDGPAVPGDGRSINGVLHIWRAAGWYPPSPDRDERTRTEREVERLREALEPVLHWYQSDEQEERPLEDIVAGVVADLQHDRAMTLQISKLHHAGAALSICAQTSGGTAGPDAALMLAIRQWTEADAFVREDIGRRASALHNQGDAE